MVFCKSHLFDWYNQKKYSIMKFNYNGVLCVKICADRIEMEEKHEIYQ